MNNNNDFFYNYTFLINYLKVSTLNININYNQNDIILNLSYKKLNNKV